MNATALGAIGAPNPVFADRAMDFIVANEFARPTLVIDRDRIAAQYDALSDGLGGAHIHSCDTGRRCKCHRAANQDHLCPPFCGLLGDGKPHFA